MSKAVIQTVLGPVSAQDWGITSMEDYILFDGSVEGDHLRAQLPSHPYPVKAEDPVTLDNIGMLYRNYVLSRDATRQTEDAVLTDEVAEFYRVGGRAILDLAVPGVSGSPGAVQDISKKTGVSIVACTGCYTWETWPPELAQADVVGHRTRFLQEITQGIGHSQVRAGHIAIMLSTLGEQELDALRAAAQVCRETGLSMTVGQPRYNSNLDEAILALLHREGVPPQRVILGGIALTTRPPLPQAIRVPETLVVDITRARRLMDLGYFVSCSFRNRRWIELLGEYDWGNWPEMSALVQLIDGDYAHRLVLGNDCRSKICLSHYGGNGYCRMLHYTLATLAYVAGVSHYAMAQMMQHNPAKLLSIPQT